MVSLLLLFVVVYSAAYILLSTPFVQRKIKETGEAELSRLLGVEVTVGSVAFEPLTDVMLYDVRIPDKEGREMLHVGKLGAGISLYRSLFGGRVVLNYAEVVGLEAHIIKETPDSKMNLQFVVDALKPKDKSKPPSPYDVALEAVVIRKGAVSFDVLSEPQKPQGVFDKNHIRISRLSSDVTIPMIKNDTTEVEIKRLSLREKSGFVVTDFTASLHIDKHHYFAENLKISMPNSIIIPEDISIVNRSGKLSKEELLKIPFELSIANSYVSLADLSAFVPQLKKFDTPLYITLSVSGTADDINVGTADVRTLNSGFVLQTSGRISGLTEKDSLKVEAPAIKLYAKAKEILDKTENAFELPRKAVDAIGLARFVSVDGSLRYGSKRLFYAGTVNTALGGISANGTLSHGKNVRFRGNLSSKSLNLGRALSKENLLGTMAFDIDADMALRNKLPYGKIEGRMRHIDIKGYRYDNITANVDIAGRSYEGELSLHDENAYIDISGLVKLDGEQSVFDFGAKVAAFNPYRLNLTKKYPDHSVSFGLESSFTGNNIDNAEGDIVISDIRYADSNGEGVAIDHFDVTARKKGEGKYLTVNSDLINGYVDGKVRFADLVPAAKRIVAVAMPSLLPDQDDKWAEEETGGNDFVYYFKLAENNELTSFFNIPVKIVHPIEMSGKFSEADRSLSFGLDAPYIMQGKKVIENTSVSVNVDGHSRLLTANAITKFDNKNGDILLVFNANAAADRLDTDINWQYDRQRDFSGKISLSSLLKVEPDTKRFVADIDVNPSTFAVNDTTWSIAPAKITVEGKKITLSGINVHRDDQFVKADGSVSAGFEDELKLQLKSIDLGYVFETLNINHVAFGGIATGDFYASGAFSPAPRLNTDNLKVKNFSYHNAPLGEADIKSSWDNDSKGIIINADIHQRNGRESFVYGAVYPTLDSLNFKFKADHLNVQILKPFMAAFTSDVSGEASGEAELYGTFKLLNIKGRMFADDFKMKVDYTNTYYSVSDSIILDPGLISIKNATVRDQYGHTATLNGSVRHDYFKNARFDFAVTDVKNMLCYDTNDRINPVWYGKVFANGSAFIKGEPGRVDIDLNMATADNSSFSFVVSDKEEAGEYTFVTFTDKRKEAQLKKEEAKIPDFLKKASEEKKQNPSTFNLNLRVDVTPGITVNLIMDPDGGGDKISATGSGNFRVEYSSSSDMKIFGSYTVDQGRYNFTLQDIIIREFKIKQGGTVAFHGDPLNAVVDLSAIYSLNANLQDLDESFAEDKDLNRTMVPVNAVLNLSGVISQPQISFDLEFPTLTQDVYRKVRSIVSTDDMMNQQIIYLLALSRFYTPEYMGATNRGSELASVASSTISNQLTNMLGQLSDKWSIAPNFHTDKGDFSDMEVELALSSRLLNNRLLLNGNFGYSDNAMNSNNFIGDFDIEYLLTKSGNFRLRAYNRYNDQNYYLRSSLTTQGVGIVFKHDFDRLLRRKKKKAVAPADSVVADTAHHSDRKPVARP